MSENLTQPIRLSYRRKAILDKLVRSDVAERMLAREEAGTLEARRALIAERNALPAKAVAAQAQAEKRAAAAAARHEAARRELKAAHDEVILAQAAVMTADPARRQFEIDRELKRTADNRLGDMYFEITRIREGFLPAVYRVSTIATPSRGFGQGERLHTNLPEVIAARKALDDARDRLAALELMAVSRAEVTAELTNIIVDLRAPLDAVGLTPPGLDEKDDFEVTSHSNRAHLDEVARLKKGMEANAA